MHPHDQSQSYDATQIVCASNDNLLLFCGLKRFTAKYQGVLGQYFEYVKPSYDKFILPPMKYTIFLHHRLAPILQLAVCAYHSQVYLV